MRLYNTLTRREEDFAPADDNTVRMYTCGLTVYARGHIGNFRTFVALDVLRRALAHEMGYTVRQVMNFTDVDDRTILESKKAGVPLREYTDRYIDLFRQDAAKTPPAGHLDDIAKPIIESERCSHRASPSFIAPFPGTGGEV